jgi:flagellar M-ring protein FliF
MANATNKSLVKSVGRWPLSRKLSLAAAALICAAIFAVIILQAQVADYNLLFAHMDNADAAEVVEWLKERKIPYRIESNGTSIYIPADKVYESRIELAGSGLPRGGGVGFEIFDKQSFGMTDFAQKINYLRAQQGELSRTISSLAPVEGARVHLALPEKRLFREQQKVGSASIILKLSSGRDLKESQVQGIIHLVAGSVEGIEAENVTVVDSSGRILSKNTSDEVAGPMTPGMLDYQQTLERRLESRAQSLLDRALGAGNSVVRVTAALDFMQHEQTEESFDPDKTAVRSEQSTQEKSGGLTAGGVPGVQSNLGDSAPSSGSTSANRSDETINYEVSKVINHKVFPVGTLKQLSVAVLVADRPGASGEGQEPRNEKELQSIRNMVSSALGIDAARGDNLEVSSMPFENAIFEMAETEIASAPNYYQYVPFIKYGLLVVGAILLYVLLARPMLKTLQGSSQVTMPMKTVEELESELNRTESLPRGQVDPALRLRDLAMQEQGAFAQIIKSWLREN